MINLRYRQDTAVCISEPSDSPYGIRKWLRRWWHRVISFHILYNAHQIWRLHVYHVYELQFQSQLHYYMIAHGITCRNTEQHAYSSNSLQYACFIQTMLIIVLLIHAVEYLCCAWIMGNSAIASAWIYLAFGGHWSWNCLGPPRC